MLIQGICAVKATQSEPVGIRGEWDTFFPANSVHYWTQKELEETRNIPHLPNYKLNIYHKIYNFTVITKLVENSIFTL